jgi:phosphohistidine phosphatase SixA
LKRISVLLFVLSFWLPGCGASNEATFDTPESVFFLVRHSEKASEDDDPPLTELGKRRSETLARLLRDADIDHIHSSDFVRCTDTAAPLSRALGVEVQIYDPRDLAAFAEKLTTTPGRHLVVGHSNTTPELARLLGGDGGSEISSDEYDRLYVVTRLAGSSPTTILLRFQPNEAP